MRSIGGVAIAVLVGCREDSGPANGYDQLPVWSATELTLEIGGSGEPGHDLDRVRGALRLGDGRIVVAEGGSNELRFFDGSAKFLFSAGRRGNGPGEFASLSAIQRLAGDTIAALDTQLRRFSWFAPSGEFVRTVTSEARAERSYTSAIAILNDGRILGEQHAMEEYRETDGPVRRAPFAYGVMGADGVRFDTVAVAPGPEMYPGVGSEGGQTFPSLFGLQFGRESVVATDGNRIFVGTNEPGGVGVYRTDGTRMGTIRIITSPEPVTEVHRNQRIKETFARFDQARVSDQVKAEWRKNAEKARFAEVFPDYERLLVGTDGTLWQEQPRRFEDEGRRFVVYDSTGAAVARVNCPDRFRPWQVGPAEIVGVWRDPDEVPRVRVYKVRK